MIRKTPTHPCQERGVDHLRDGLVVQRVSFNQGRCSKGVDLVLDGYPKLVAIDEAPNHEIVHSRRLGKTDRATDEPFGSVSKVEMEAPIPLI